MKKKYEAPKIDVEYYAQFENVFTKCTKGNPGDGCIDLFDGEKPKGPDYAAYGAQKTSR